MEEEKITLSTRIKSMFSQGVRVWHLLKKPDKTEFSTVAKVSAIGLGIIGILGFAIAMIMTFLSLK